MEAPNVKVKIQHSTSTTAWHLTNTKLGAQFMIATVPYVAIKDSEMLTEIEKSKALKHAKFLKLCFDNAEVIVDMFS